MQGCKKAGSLWWGFVTTWQCCFVIEVNENSFSGGGRAIKVSILGMVIDNSKNQHPLLKF